MGRGLERCFPNLNENPVDVKGLKIASNTITYYYIYGEVLAALSRPQDNKCDQAMKTLSEVRTELTNNPDDYKDAKDTILKIIQDGELICKSLAAGPTPDLSTPSGTEAAPVLDTAIPTYTPVP